MLVAAGGDPPGPADLGEWRERHADLHPSHVLLGELGRRYETELLERRPYLYRWLGGPASEALERAVIEAGAGPAVGLPPPRPGPGRPLRARRARPPPGAAAPRFHTVA